MRKIKYKIIFVKQIENSYEFIKKKRINITKKSIVYDKTPYLLTELSTQKPIAKGLKKYYFILLNKGFISFDKVKSNVDMEMVGKFISKSIFTNVFSHLMNTKFGRNITDLIIGGITGLAVGLLIGFMI